MANDASLRLTFDVRDTAESDKSSVIMNTNMS